ncbi:MAG: tetratricopeptide repeat protein [Prevotellaceae bacterium]|nr:tetratricopeptide repeat protein [Prevotellaceae bacterium]
MGFWKTLFGGEETTPEQELKHKEDRDFDTLKTDGQKASRIGRSEYAVMCFRKALEIHDDLETRDYLAHALINCRQFDEAQAELDILQQAEPENPQVALLKANVSFMQEDYEKMRDTLLPFADKEEYADEKHLISFWLAKALLCLDCNEDAVECLTKSVNAKPDFWDAYLLRAQTYLKYEQTELAEKDTDYLLSQLGEQEETLLMSARIKAKKGNRDSALAVYDKIMELNPFSVEGLRERGMLKIDLGDEEGGKADIAESDAINGTGSEEGIEEQIKQKYRSIDPYGIFG